MQVLPLLTPRSFQPPSLAVVAMRSALRQISTRAPSAPDQFTATRLRFLLVDSDSSIVELPVS